MLHASVLNMNLLLKSGIFSTGLLLRAFFNELKESSSVEVQFTLFGFFFRVKLVRGVARVAYSLVHNFCTILIGL